MIVAAVPSYLCRDKNHPPGQEDACLICHLENEAAYEERGAWKLVGNMLRAAPAPPGAENTDRKIHKT